MNLRRCPIKIVLYCLVLLLIYLLSPVLFKKFLDIKEPAFIPPLRIEGAIPLRSDLMGDGHFGAMRSNGRSHKGLDIMAKRGEPVFASQSGFAKIGEVRQGMGKYVKILHHDGHVTVYGHLDTIVVKDNKWVWQGQRLGTVGKTGNADSSMVTPHLHFEIRKDGVAFDPVTYIANYSSRKSTNNTANHNLFAYFTRLFNK